jgi:hypothetical protein
MLLQNNISIKKSAIISQQISDNKLIDNRGSRLPALHPILDMLLQNTILHKTVPIKKSAKISQKMSDNKLLHKKNITGKISINDFKR